MLKTAPVVFAVDKEYQIMVPVNRPCLVWVQIGHECYCDESNGIMRSSDSIHKVTVPMEALDAAGEYTLFARAIVERKPYFTTTEEPVSYNYKFFPLPEENIRVFHIADAHGKIAEPAQAANCFGDVDLLILNGDILDHSGDPSKFLNVYELCSLICKGNKPVVFSRGNHDLRGAYAEKFADYTPNHNGNTFYSFRIGSVWGLVLDCGEDKADNHPEYGFTVACHQFRKKQSSYIDSIIANPGDEYAAEGVKHKLVISHVPFTWVDEHPFDIEQDTYKYWAKTIKNNIEPELMICGHTHSLDIVLPGDSMDNLGQPCPVVIGSKPEEQCYTGSAFILKRDGTEVAFVKNDGSMEKHFLTKANDVWKIQQMH